MDDRRLTRVAAIAAATVSIAACSQHTRTAGLSAIQTVSFTNQDRECMARAMYFESHRGADEGMLAVGTVVANRKDSGNYGSSICEVVGQKRAFAPGVMTRTMDGEAADRARRAAETVLSGRRHPGVGKAMFFHTAGYKFRYPNMRYVLVAGGNAFYEKREVQTASDASENARSRALALAYARIDPTGAAKPILVASAAPIGPAPTIAPQPSGGVSDAVVTSAAPAAAPVKVQTIVVARAAAPQAPTPDAAPAALAYTAPSKPAVAMTTVPPVGGASASAEIALRPVPARAERSVAVASVEQKPVAASKRVLSAATLSPVLASVAPAPKVRAPVEPTPIEASAGSVGYNGEVAAAFSAFETR